LENSMLRNSGRTFVVLAVDSDILLLSMF
jgi:hypothetical protein